MRRAQLGDHRVFTDLPELAADLPAVFQHSNYSPNNWLWSNNSKRLARIDSETPSTAPSWRT
ncbi:hypothetical protein CEP50_18805 [Actinopolyspora mortivallis]|uniref:Uncharacterized protein n=1 Tax=Actinopolyspora mortivallis TaxID=33906 RepID=A0A2T0GRS7_ACTMO|nr:hypothetical protein CEP50_18805 [Actinopolyspora mortivallis]